MSKTIVKIYFNNGCTSLLYNDTTSVQDIIKAVIKGRLSQNELRYKKCFMLRATKYSTANSDSITNTNEQTINNNNNKIETFMWLPYNFKIKEVLKSIENDNFDNWKILLRVRYLPADLNEIKFKDRITFTYFYEQTKNDFMFFNTHLIDDLQHTIQTVLDLGCLEMRRSFQNMKPNALDKKINFEYLEKDVGLRRFFPDKVLQLKSKNIKKLIIKGIKEYENYNEEDCMILYLEKLKNLWKYDEEVYECHLGGTWSVPIKVNVSNNGISCFMNEKCEPFQSVGFEKIIEIYVNYEYNNLVQLKLNQTEELLTFKFNDKRVACNFALLIDGYCMLKNNLEIHTWCELNNTTGIVNTSINQKNVEQRQQKHENRASAEDGYLKKQSFNDSIEKAYQHNYDNYTTNNNYRIKSIELLDDVNYDNDQNGEYAFMDTCYEIDRNSLDLVEKLGAGNFGDVYKGTYNNKIDIINVAIKMLKMNNDEEDKFAIANKFMQEARIMQSFDHPHIIKLIGVCSDYPSLIIMELAQYGQLRKYLQTNFNQIEISMLILYCYQLNTAMSYLESKKFVHRDIAARNVLVFTPECVKLSDFGLSRAVEENFYLASKSKLPIKWLAPESINFRKFTSSSDVWMFGVCMWEILSFGEKPFQGIKNTDVIHLIENKQRLEKPLYCPDELYSIMLKCWEYDPLNRPKFSQLNDVIHSIFMNYKERKIVIASYSPPKSETTNESNKSYSDSNSSTNYYNEHQQQQRLYNVNNNENNNANTITSSPITTSTASAVASAPPPKPKRVNSNINAKFQYPSCIGPTMETFDIQKLKITKDKELKQNLSTDNLWLNERLKYLNHSNNNETHSSTSALSPSSSSTTTTTKSSFLLSPHLTRTNNNSFTNLTSTNTNTNSTSSSSNTTNLSASPQHSKDIQLRDHTYNFIHKISTFVHSLSKYNNQQIESELKTILYSWNHLCEIYETYPVILSKSKKINELVDDLDHKLSSMIEELKLNHLDKVISISLELAHKANQLFCTIVTNNAVTANNNNTTNSQQQQQHVLNASSNTSLIITSNNTPTTPSSS